MRSLIPRLRLWHLVGFTAAAAGLFAILDFRRSVDDPAYAAMKRLRSLDSEERIKAAQILSTFRPPARQAIEPLLVALKDADPRVRAASANTLSFLVSKDSDAAQISAVKSALTASLQDRDIPARRAAAVSLAMLMPEASVVVPTLIDTLQEAPSDGRAQIINMLGFYAAKDVSAWNTVLASLEDPDVWVRNMAVRSLGLCVRSPELAPRVIPAVLPSLRDSNYHLRTSAVYVLSGAAAVTGVEVPELVQILADPAPSVRMAALSAHPNKDVSPQWMNLLIQATRDSDALVRSQVLSKLQSMGADAEPALPAIRQAKEDPDVSVRRVAGEAESTVEAKTKLFHDKLLPELLADLKSENDQDRHQALEMIGKAGRKAASAIPAVVGQLENAAPKVRLAAVNALREFGQDAQGAVPALTRRLDDTDESVRKAAKRAIAAVQASPKSKPGS